MKKAFSIVLAALVIAATLGLAACSSGSSSSSSSGSKSSDSNLTPQSLPSNGYIFSGNSSGSSSIEVKASSSESCWVKVYTSSGKLQISFFVQAGKTATVNVPSGTYSIHFASGKTWYGKSNLFGSKTAYGQDKSVTIQSGYILSYSLTSTTSGNWSMGSLDSSNF